MKGVVFNAAEEAVTEIYSADTWDDLIDAAGVDGIYSSVGDYPDTELVNIVKAASEATGLSVDEVLVAVGRKALKYLAARVENLLVGCAGPFEMLLMIHDVIHVEVMKLYEDAVPPSFEYWRLSDGLRMRYRSARCLDALAEGLILGVGDRFDVELSVSRSATDDGSVFLDVRRADGQPVDGLNASIPVAAG